MRHAGVARLLKTKEEERQLILGWETEGERERDEKTKRKLNEERLRGVRGTEVDLMEDGARRGVTPMEGAR